MVAIMAMYALIHDVAQNRLLNAQYLHGRVLVQMNVSRAQTLGPNIILGFSKTHDLFVRGMKKKGKKDSKGLFHNIF